MENLDLLKSQIHSSCRLALPEGLNDLMWDISREVLRAQPQNLCAFIADYLSVLLVARENLHIAAHVCTDVCDGICHALLEDELRNFGFHDDVAMEAKNIIQNCFERNEVNEAKIMLELLKMADLEENHLPAIQNAIRSAFMRHQANRNVIYMSSSSDDDDDVTRAARHTLRLYRQTKPTKQEMDKAAVTVQAAYRAYGVKRKSDHEKKPKEKKVKKVTASKRTKGKFITFGNEESCQADSFADDASEKTEDISVSQPKSELLHTASSISLAGSYLNLPMYKPYCPYDPEIIHEIDERNEKEHSMFDYTLETDKHPRTEKKISFHKLEIIGQDSDKSEKTIEEMIGYDEAYEETESVGEELLKTTENQEDVYYYIEETIEDEKINDTSDYSNVDIKYKNKEVHPTKGMDIISNGDKTVQMASEHRDCDEMSDNVEKTISTEYKTYEVTESIGEKLLKSTEETIEVEKTNDTNNDYTNVDIKNKKEKVHTTKGMDIGRNGDKTVEMTNENRDSNETSNNVEKTVSTEYTMYDADDVYDGKDSEVGEYTDGTVKHVNSVEDMNVDTENVNEDRINDKNEVIRQIDDIF